MKTGNVRLITRKVQIKDNNGGEYWALQDWAEWWNRNNGQHGHVMYIEVIGDSLAAFTRFNTEDEAALFKLTYL
jgi:hypothetical protein